MNRSIRWSLLGWYALILILVIGTFGGLLYNHRRTTGFDRIDAELRAHSRALSASIEWEDDEGFDLEQTERYAVHFEQTGGDAPWFVAWDDSGRVLLRSPGAPADVELRPTGLASVGDRRVDVADGPHGSRVIVSRGTAAVREEVAGFLETILLAGGGVLLLSLAGGWLLVSRVLGPIHRMTETAERISGTDRSDRIDVGRTESELGQLASTLNGAFDRLQDALERQTRFTADASHELRTPLAVVVTNAELGLMNERSPEQYRELLEICLRAGRRMTGVVEGLLSLARSDGGAGDMGDEEVDLRAVVRDAVEFLTPLAEERQVTLAETSGPAVVRGDADRLREAIGNLVTNAVRYNREGGSVELTLSSHKGEGVLSVTDTGAGIAEEDLLRVFERFYRVDEARSREAGGSGLGLAITKWIVEAHGGSVSLSSKPGDGTTAVVRLPLATRSPRA